MRYTEIAIAKPFEGEPKINLADVFGASPKKPIILRIPVTGKRPVKYGAENLVQGLVLENGIITGQVENEGRYDIVLTAENELGRTEKKITLEIKENTVLLTPLLGFTSWNAFESAVTQADIENTAKKMVDLGICEYGYSYINTDSGWQGEYGGKYDAIMPNEKFPDMKKMTDTIHSLGLKCGIYSTPMLSAWGCPKEFESIPGCTQGDADELFGLTNGGIGKIRKEKNNVEQWSEWGFDYLKYDWRPCDPYNAELMRRELIKSERDFGFCVTVSAVPGYVNYWSKYVNSYRNNVDSLGYWDNFIEIFDSYNEFVNVMKKGHFYDLDMLDTGTCKLVVDGSKLSEDEQICVYSLRAFMGSPIQISSTLENAGEFELSLYCNEEIIAINQDCAFSSAKPYMLIKDNEKDIRVYRRKLVDGSEAYAVFNLGEKREDLRVYLDGVCDIRDVWAKKDMGCADSIYLVRMMPHSVRIFKTKAK